MLYLIVLFWICVQLDAPSWCHWFLAISAAVKAYNALLESQEE